MDLRLFASVLRRFRVLVGLFFIVAVTLSFLSMYRVTFASGSVELSQRGNEEWISYSQLLVTQPGFAWGDTLAGSGTKNPSTSAQDVAAASESRLSTLAVLYSQFATGDGVKQIMLRQGPLHGI